MFVTTRTFRAPAAPATCVTHRESEMWYKLCFFFFFFNLRRFVTFFFSFCFPTLKIKDVGSLKRDRWENSNNSDSESCFWCLNYPEKVKWSSVVSTLGAMMNDESVCVWECVLQRQQRGRERVPFCSAVCVGEGVLHLPLDSPFLGINFWKPSSLSGISIIAHM